MRFFTLEWWCGIQYGEIHGDPAADYRAYLATIRDKLPADLVTLQETVSLHDGRLRELELTPATASLVLVLDGSDGCGGSRRFTLRYSGVSSMRSVADPDMGLHGPHGYGDFGYDEVDVTPTGEFEHRMLFSSGIELIVQFVDVRLAREGMNEPSNPSDGGGLDEAG